MPTCLLLLIVAGCATDPTPDKVTAGSASRDCIREHRTGTNVPPKDCTPALTDAERQQMNEAIRNRSPAPPTTRTSTGG